MNTFRFPSLLPPCYEPEKEKSDLLDVQVLERKEKEYKQWVNYRKKTDCALY